MNLSTCVRTWGLAGSLASFLFQASGLRVSGRRRSSVWYHDAGAPCRLTRPRSASSRGIEFNLTSTPQLFKLRNRAVTAANFAELAGARGERQGQIALRFTF